MIAQISGELVEKELTRVLIDVQGVGYELMIPMSTFDHLPQLGKKVTLKTLMHVREDLMQLFGFFSDREKQLFTLVCSVSGIGPKIGLNVLSCMTVESFCANIVNQDVKANYLASPPLVVATNWHPTWPSAAKPVTTAAPRRIWLPRN